MLSNYAETVKGTLNFAADRSDGGQFSNTRPDRTSQKLVPAEAEIRNGRIWPQLPSLENEGLVLVEHPCGRADWTDQQWIGAEYVPSCVELVKKLTGAKVGLPIYAPLQRRVDYGDYRGAAPAAGFVHIDQTLECALAFARPLAESHGVSCEHAIIYNIWKPMTPPPQDFPLAVADRRSIPEEDYVPGETVEYLGENEEKLVAPYIMLAHSDKPIYYYFPDMTPDESIVFIGEDLDPSQPLGCAHSAFLHPSPSGDCVPRASIETRVLAIFD